MLDYDVSLYELVELVIIFETSPSSSKTEFGCSSYGRFGIDASASFSRPETPADIRRRLRCWTEIFDLSRVWQQPVTLVGYRPDTPVCASRWLWRKWPNGYIFVGPIKGPLLPHLLKASTGLFSALSLLHWWPWEAFPSSPSLPWFLHIIEGFGRGDLDLQSHKAKSPLSEGNLVDLDLGVLGVLLFVLPLLFPHKH